MDKIKELFPETKMTAKTREQGRGENFIIETLIFIAVFIVVEIAASIPTMVVGISDIMQNERVTEAIELFVNGKITFSEYLDIFTAAVLTGRVMLATLFGTGIATILTILYCRLFEKRKPSTMGFVKSGALAEYGVGILVGAGLLSAAVGICVLTGAFTVTKTANPAWGMVALFFAGFIIQGMSEETIFRGFFMVSLSRRSNLAAAVAVSSIAFGCAHLSNNHVTALAVINITLFGAFAGLYILKRGSIWGACAIHSLWNFMQGSFYGISVSGSPSIDSVFITTADPAKTLLNGGAFGIEGGLAATVVLTAAIIAVSLTKTKRSEIAEPRSDAPQDTQSDSGSAEGEISR